MDYFSSRTLKRWYNEINARYYEGRLPDDVDILFAPVDGAHARLIPNRDGSFTIIINPAYSIEVKIAKQALLHEVAHLALYPYVAHGPRFDEEIDRLYCLGAYRGLL